MARVIALIMGVVALVLITSLVGMLFLYASWNWGLVPALGAGIVREITLGGAFWLGMCLSIIGNMFKASVTAKENSRS